MVDNLIEFFKGDDNCIDVKRMGSVPFVFLYGKNICAKRQGDTFVESVRPKHNSCPENYKICGKGKEEENICANVHDPCPINDIKVLMPNEQLPADYY